MVIISCDDSFAQGNTGFLFAGGKKRCDKQKFVTIAKPCFAHSRNYSIAQGTIEYLVIVGVVVVLSLVVVALIVNLGSVPSQQILSESEKLGNVGGGGIVIVEAVSDFDESGFVVLRNYSGGDVALTKIRVDDNSYDYSNEFIGSTKEEVFNVKNLCVCKSGETRRTCEFEFFYLTQSGLEKKESKSVTVNCASGVSVGGGSGGSGGKVVEPIFPEPNGGTPPVISLIPVYYSVGKSVNFEFEVDAEKDISSCTLFVGDDSNTYYNISDGSNTINYTFLTDKLVDYNISCVDNSNNVGYSDSLTINVDSNSFQITTCVELQDMNKNLGGHYELMNNIDCTNFGEFTPIGGDYNGYYHYYPRENRDPFVGTLDGKNYSIKGVTMTREGFALLDHPSRPGSTIQYPLFSGIFGIIHEASIQNIKLESIKINQLMSSDSGVWDSDYGSAGGLVGLAMSSNIKNIHLSNSNIIGIVKGGGLIGEAEYSVLENLSVVDSNVNESLSDLSEGYCTGGIVGLVEQDYDFSGSIISDFYFKGIVKGGEYVGGLAGCLDGPHNEVTAKNLTSEGVIYSSYAAGGFFGAIDISVTWYLVNFIVSLEGNCSSNNEFRPNDGSYIPHVNKVDPFTGINGDRGID